MKLERSQLDVLCRQVINPVLDDEIQIDLHRREGFGKMIRARHATRVVPVAWLMAMGRPEDALRAIADAVRSAYREVVPEWERRPFRIATRGPHRLAEQAGP
jgi:hypothetical protein